MSSLSFSFKCSCKNTKKEISVVCIQNSEDAQEIITTAIQTIRTIFVENNLNKCNFLSYVGWLKVIN